MIAVDPAWPCVTSSAATSNPIVLQVVDQPHASVNISASPSMVCAGDPISFTADAKNAGNGVIYAWFINDSKSGDNSPSFSTSQLGAGATVYCVIEPGMGSCSASPVSSNILSALVHPLPRVAVAPADTIILSGAIALLRAQVSPDVISFNWTPATELSNPTSLDPTTIPLRDSVLFTFTAETADGCKSNGEALVKVYRALRMPNAFTPNGNGANNVFRIPPGITLQLQELAVFDRYGMKIFSTSNGSQGWDGTVKGHLAQPGVYVWTVKGRDLLGPVTAGGTVILVR
jgi:gliding motility-associated-like protein